MSHFQWAKSIGIETSEFINLVRGFYLNNKAVFYKGNFEYDEECEFFARKYIESIKEYCNSETVEIWLGKNVGPINTRWEPKFYLGTF